MNFPAVTDAMLDKVEYDPIDDDSDPRRELFDPGHEPVVAWRLTRVPVAR